MRILRAAGVTYAPRKLTSYAQALAYFILLEKEVEESNNEKAIQLWVQAFKDRDTFVSMYLKELESTDSEITRMMEGLGCSSGCPTCSCSHPAVTVNREPVPAKPWDEIQQIIVCMLDEMVNFDESEIRKVVNFHNETNKTEQNLSISHTNSKTAFLKKSFEMLGLPLNHPKLVGPRNKVFVKKQSKVLASEGGLKGKHTQAAYCYQVNIQHFSYEVKQRILDHFQQQEIVPEAIDSQPSQSQNFEEYHQSQNNFILYCKLCEHQAGSAEDMKTHTEQDHVRCTICKKLFAGNTSLKLHMDTDHSRTPCTICGEEVETSNLKVHLTSHRQKEGFKRALEDVGKIKNRITGSKKEKIDLRLAYRLFTEENKTYSKVSFHHFVFVHVILVFVLVLVLVLLASFLCR